MSRPMIVTCKTTLTALVLACTTHLSVASAATPELPRTLPAYGVDKPLTLPPVAKKTLSNGLEVWVIQRDGLPRVDAVLAVLGAGLAADPADAPGFANLFAGLLSEGTDRHDSKAIAETMQGLGGGIEASASNDGVIVSANAMANFAAPMVDMLAEVARTPAFPASEVKLAQANALQSLKAAEAEPSFKADRALLAATYGDHPYGRTQPNEAMITGVTPERLRTEHARRFHPDRALLVLTGRIAPAEGFALAQKAFGDWKAGGEEVAATPPAQLTTDARRILIQRDGSVQSTLRLGRPAVAASDPDYLPLRFTGVVLGSGISSRLNQNLREGKGYTYGARASYSGSRAGGRVSGGADVRNEVTGASLKEFMGEYARLGSEPMSARELADTKRYIVGGFILTNQLQAAMASSLASNWLVGLPEEYLEQFVPKVRAVEVAQVQAMAKKYFDPKAQSIVVVGDAAAIAGQLKPFGEFELQKK